MYSVTRRVKMVKQPYGGYINKKQFEIVPIDDGNVLHESENIHASLVGLAVDYLTRFVMGTPASEAFHISVSGAMALDWGNSGLNSELDGKEDPVELAKIFLSDEFNKKLQKQLKRVEERKAQNLLSTIKGLDDNSIISACKLVGYDVCFRAGTMGYKPIEGINPDKSTVENINIMVNRSLHFWNEYGPIVKDGFTFEGGYTDIVSTGDGDFLTKDTLWDFKVLKREPDKDNTLQLLMYYIMGIHSVHPEFQSIEKLGIFNPRMNKVYLVNVSSIPQAVIDEVSTEVIGYK